MAYRVSADIGGTFTDFVVQSTGGEAFIGKVPTTPENPALGVLNGLRDLVPDPSDVEFFVHGTTVGLNAFLERRGERVLLIATAGHGDSYTIARGNRIDLYNPQYRKPGQLTPRRDVHEVRGRVKWDGTVVEPLNADDFAPIIDKIREENIGSVAVCFLHAFAFPAHEIEARDIIKAALPDVTVSLSHEMVREWREYERASTTVLNAYVAPITRKYLSHLRDELDDASCDATLHVMQSSGGVMTADSARERPVLSLLSGPVGGAVGGVALSKSTGRPNLLCVDMGGTSFDLSLVIDGQAEVSSETYLEGLPLLMPIVNIHTIGTGGGSLAWLEEGALRVGPKSAGAVPGPACYGRGGDQPTVTDANLFLNRLGASSLLSGQMTLDRDATDAAMGSLAEKAGMSSLALAEGILAISNAAMADAIRTITIERGIDPREFALVAYGGAGPMQAAFLAKELGIRETIVPRFPGTFSALGMQQTDIRHDVSKAFFHAAASVSGDDLAALYAQLEADGRARLEAEGITGENTSYLASVDMRYVGQEFALNVSVERAETIDDIIAAFHAAHLKRYGHANEAAPVEFVTVRLAALGALPVVDPSVTPNAGDDNTPDATRIAVFDGEEMQTPVYVRERLSSAYTYSGPMIVEEQSATTVVPPGFTAHVDARGDLIVTMEG